MKVAYRFLDSWDKANNHYVIGIVYSGFSTPCDGNAVLSTLHGMKEKFLSVKVRDVKISDIPNLTFNTHRYELLPIEEINIPDDDDEWTPDELLEDRQIALENIRKQRKTA